MTSTATGSGMLVKRALASKDTKVSLGATFSSLRDLDTSLLPFD